MTKNIILCLFAFTCWSTFSCNDPATIDTNLVDIDLLDLQNETDFDISSFTIEEDSVLTFQSANRLQNRYPFGISEDPVFGTSTSSVVSQISLQTVSAPDFTDAVVDSVILQIVLNPEDPFYGDSTSLVGMEVFEMTETIDANTNFYSNYDVDTEATPIGAYEGVPNYSDSLEVLVYQGDTLALDTVPPVMRIALDNSFGEKIIAAGDALTSSIDFVEMFKGLELRPTLTGTNLVAFDLDFFNSVNRPGLTGAIITIYYTVDSVQKAYNLTFNPSGSVKFLQHKHDYAGAQIEEFIGDVVLGDSLTFVQGLSGVNTVIKFNDLDKLSGTLVNGASLEVYATALNGNEELYPVPEQLVLREEQADGALNYTRDFQAAAGTGILSAAGGTPEDIGGGIFKYTFNVGSQLQDIIEGNRPEEIYIRTNTKVATMRRAVLFGAGHSTYPVKLTVTYTKL